MLRHCSTAAASSSWRSDRRAVLVGCGNNYCLRGLMLAKGGAAAFAAGAFLDLVLLDGGLLKAGGAACADYHSALALGWAHF